MAHASGPSSKRRRRAGSQALRLAGSPAQTRASMGSDTMPRRVRGIRALPAGRRPLPSSIDLDVRSRRRYGAQKSQQICAREERMNRRRFVAGTAATAAVLAIRPSFADDAYPTHAITIVNPFPPGGANELVTRPLAAELEPILKQPVVIETKAGASGQVGAQFVASARPDGYTLLTHNTALAGFAEVDKLFGARRNSPMQISSRSRVSSPIRACSYATTSSRTRRCKSSSTTRANVRMRSFSARPGSTAPSIFRWRCSSRRRAACSCGICRPMAAARP